MLHYLWSSRGDLAPFWRLDSSVVCLVDGDSDGQSRCVVKLSSYREQYVISQYLTEKNR